MRMEQHQQTMEHLPLGFRFFPTDEELITCYLARKAVDASFTSAAIRDVDLYNFDPWDLPCQELQAAAAAAAGGGDRHQECCCYFCTKGSKYSSGVRARRATRSGYWKSTGKDKAVYSSTSGRLVGTKKTLVFYGGRAPGGRRLGGSCARRPRGERPPQRSIADHDLVLMKKPETETVHDQLPSPAPGYLLPMKPDDAAPPAYSHRADAMDGDEKDRQHRQMAHEELLMMNNSSGLSCSSPPCLIHDEHIGTNCTALQFMQMQSNGTDYSLPELLEYDDGYDDLLKGSGEAQDTGSVDRRAETSAASVDHSIRLGVWNFNS